MNASERRPIEAVRDWWASNPMTYGLEHGGGEFQAANGHRLSLDLGSREFFSQADEVFYGFNRNLHDSTGYFGRLFDYGSYEAKPVLEVGCGLGCMAMNWAQHGARVTAVDLNPLAVRQTRQRFDLYGATGEMLEADARHLPFGDGAFDYAYSWGVLHHSPELQASVRELHRVIRPGGACGVMLYHRDSLLYRYTIQYLQGWLHDERRFLNNVQLASRYGDGDADEGNPHTWPVTSQEAKRCFFRLFDSVEVRVLGTDVDYVLNLLLPGLGNLLPLPIRKSLARRWGWSLWISGRKVR